jgi:hypothetical protein
MPFDNQNPQSCRSVASSQPEPKGEWVRHTCPKVTPLKPPSWVSNTKRTDPIVEQEPVAPP